MGRRDEVRTSDPATFNTSRNRQSRKTNVPIGEAHYYNNVLLGTIIRQLIVGNGHVKVESVWPCNQREKKRLMLDY